MTKRFVTRFAAALALALGIAAPVAAEPPVVVELFTSQGCSSCPPADDLLGELAGRPDVLALGWHVDYWDYIGWRDPFAQPAFTERQNAYAERLGLNMVYTPQMVVDGAAHATGSDRAAVKALIAAAQDDDGPMLTLLPLEGGGWTLRVGSAAPAPTARLLWIGYLPQATRNVRSGENRGRELTNHNIVREMTVVAEWRGEAAEIALPGDAGDLRRAALLQAADGRILSAAVTPARPAPRATPDGG